MFPYNKCSNIPTIDWMATWQATVARWKYPNLSTDLTMHMMHI